MKSIERVKMYQNIEKHGINLNTIFNTGLEPVELCKKLHRLERKAHEITTLECNTGEDYDEETGKILDRVKKILKVEAGTDIERALFVNGDARGYALKIRDSYVRAHNLNIYQDWGGYGIISPDFTPIN